MESIQQVQDALEVLYTSKDQHARDYANEALQTFQKTVRPCPLLPRSLSPAAARRYGISPRLWPKSSQRRGRGPRDASDGGGAFEGFRIGEPHIDGRSSLPFPAFRPVGSGMGDCQRHTSGS